MNTMLENKKTRIAIAGIGGIGGYLGGKLAHYYENFENVDIVFIARGESLDAIKANGLTLMSKDITYQCKPTLVSDNPDAIGPIDIFLLCTKTFAVAATLKRYAQCITASTTVITTQNTINGRAVIEPCLPDRATLMEGCIYIASNKVGPGKINHISGPAKLFFGTDRQVNAKGQDIAKIFNYAGIDTTYSADIGTALWKKFMFVSPAAIVTALFRITFTEILESREAEYLYIDLIGELMQLAKAKGVFVDEATVLNNIGLLGKFSGYVKSSFQLDLEKNAPSEIGALVEEVIAEAQSLNLSTPCYDQALNDLQAKISTLEKPA
ncbi:MAG TPA: 2-dehydropantoate 2-reductase [Flavobacterium sp.]|nr:2-dehydropantoate 2-reductase [Flavobacterium sp.]HPJ10163.1 2-dehydropantoate 2-reductase [Flavobacterium sp.]